MTGPDKTVRVQSLDLSHYETYRVCGPNGNAVTFLVSGRYLRAPGGDGGRFTIHLIIWGDFGPWEHYWSHAGGEDMTWWVWLYDTDMYYFLSKVTGNTEREFDFETSQKHVLSEIIRMRREDDVYKNDARKAYDAIKAVKGGNKDIFIEEIGKLTYTPEGKFRPYTMFDEYWDMAHEHTKPRLVWFWDHIWRPFIEQAKRTEGFTQPDPMEIPNVDTTV